MYLFFDTETNGLPKNPEVSSDDLDNWPRLVQLAWALYSYDGKEIARDSNIIKPVGFSILDKAVEVHGINTEMAVEMGKDLLNVLKGFIFYAKASSHVVAHNLRFDAMVVKAEMARVGYDFPFFSLSGHCTKVLSADYCKIPGVYGYKWPKLSELHYFLFKENFDGAHDALSDARICAKCFFELKRRGIVKE